MTREEMIAFIEDTVCNSTPKEGYEKIADRWEDEIGDAFQRGVQAGQESAT